MGFLQTIVIDSKEMYQKRRFIFQRSNEIYESCNRPQTEGPGDGSVGFPSAYDFVVINKFTNRIVAGTKSATARNVWDEPGWTARLKQAITNAGNKFDGPLGSPGGRGVYEPWHYVYKQIL